MPNHLRQLTWLLSVVVDYVDFSNSNSSSANGTATTGSMTIVDLSLSTIDCDNSAESLQVTDDTPIDGETTTTTATQSVEAANGIKSHTITVADEELDGVQPSSSS